MSLFSSTTNGSARPASPDGHVKVNIAWSRPCEPDHSACRLDIDASPAAIIKGSRHRIIVRMGGADVDVKATFDVLQCTPTTTSSKF